jgi:hypothetical protein
MEICGKFKFKVSKNAHNLGWYYEIFSGDMIQPIAGSTEYFESAGIARYAAIGHITLLEENSSSGLGVHF